MRLKEDLFFICLVGKLARSWWDSFLFVVGGNANEILTGPKRVGINRYWRVMGWWVTVGYASLDEIIVPKGTMGMQMEELEYLELTEKRMPWHYLLQREAIL